jgi:hypothetical protein
MGAQCGKDLCRRALTMDLVLMTLKVENGILYIGGWINPPSC